MPKSVNVDLMKTMIPRGGIEVAIEGKTERWRVDQPFNLLSAIAETYCVLKAEAVSGDESFLERIKVLEYDEKKRFIRVSIGRKKTPTLKF